MFNEHLLLLEDVEGSYALMNYDYNIVKGALTEVWDEPEVGMIYGEDEYGAVGYLDYRGNIVLPFIFDKIKHRPDGAFKAIPLSMNVLCKQVYIIDLDLMKSYSDEGFEFVRMFSGLIGVYSNGSVFRLIENRGRRAVMHDFQTITPLSFSLKTYEMYSIVHDVDGDVGVINEIGREIVPIRYRNVIEKDYEFYALDENKVQHIYDLKGNLKEINE
jgi:hypothetical protein